jgi:hypothetical protein
MASKERTLVSKFAKVVNDCNVLPDLAIPIKFKQLLINDYKSSIDFKTRFEDI